MARTEQEMQHAHSMSSQEAGSTDETKKVKSRRPPNTAFRQQRLKAWQPILTPKTVLPIFFAVGVIFAPIGGLLLWASSQVQEISIDYSDCPRMASDNWTDVPSSRVQKFFKKSSYMSHPVQWKRNQTSVSYDNGNVSVQVDDTWICSLKFDIESDLKPPVLFYYRLTNFYQNHRRYVKSFDQDQLKGDARTSSQISHSDCDPLRLDTNSTKPYYPCGLIANSIFNDTFHSPVGVNVEGDYQMSNKGIAWESDKDLYKPTKYKPTEVVPPPNWRRRWANYSDEMPPPDLTQDEAFQVWMRTAGLPTFSKLAMRNDHDVMKSGQYQVDIYDEFNTTLYGGSKSVLISTRTVMGGKNPFLGIAYIVVGGLCILMGALFTATHVIKPRKLGDHTYLSWDKETTNTTAAATSRSVTRGGDTA